MKDNIELPLISKRNSKNRDARTPFEDIQVHQASPSKFQKITSKFVYFFFADTFSFAKFINKKPGQITYDEVPLPYEPFNIENKVHELSQQRQMVAESPNKESFLRTCIKTIKLDFIASILNVFVLVNCHILCSVCLGKIMNAVTDITLGIETDKESTIMYAVGFCIFFFCKNMLENWWAHFSFLMGGGLRLSITGFMYEKLNKVALSSLQEINIGKVINLFANDFNDLDGGPGFVPPMVLAPYSVLLCSYLLWSYFGVFSLISLAILLGSLFLGTYLSNLSEKPRKEKNLVTDQRIKYTTEFIENIRLIKLYAWEKPLRAIITDLRDKEVVLLKKLGDIDSIARTFSESASYVAILIMSIIYVYSGGVLTPEKIYTSFMILAIARFWIIFCFHIGRMFVVGTRLTNQRVEDILAVKDVARVKEESYQAPGIGEGIIKFEDFSASWSQDNKLCLDKINLTIKPKELIALIGKIGSGKSTFLMSFLKEIPVTTGKLLFSGSLAYVEQEPVIFSGSVRDNILFGKEFDEMFYARVLRACNLDEDLKQFDHGDETIVGERGVTISGGQKARMSLARALYSQSDIYLLDDPLSAVDSRVGKIIFERAIKQLLKDKTVILVTHHLNYAKEADRVIVMKDGGVEAEGRFDDLVRMKLDLLQIFSKENEVEQTSERKGSSSLPRQEGEEEPRRRTSFMFERKSSVDAEALFVGGEKQTIKEEDSTTVSRETYLNYLKESQSYWPILRLVGIYALNYVIIIMLTKHIGYWAQEQNKASHQNELDEFNNLYYILTSLLLLIVIMVCVFTKATLTIRFLLDTDSKLHEKMLYRISRTFVAFFDSTPIGTILNRFSNDLGVLDRANWPVVYDFFNLLSALVLYMSYLCIINWQIGIPCVLMIYGLYHMKVYFTKPNIELKRLEAISRSPIFSEISSTLNGLLIIRVYNQGPRFMKNFLDILYKNSRVFVHFARMGRGFSIGLQICLYIMCVSGIGIFIYVAYYSTLEAGIFGLALYYLVAIADDSVWAIRQTIFLDINMQSAQRVHQYCILPEEAQEKIEGADERLKKGSGEWPYEGRISFDNVYLKYPNTSKYALNGLSFTVEPNSKVGIVGRTGAGKSSMIQALFRIVEVEDRSKIQIDGVNIRTLGLETLRQSLSILPQTPVIFTGTIRRNLDPFGVCTEVQIWQALEQVSLSVYVKSLEQGLDTDMSVSNSVFSVGQKQLVCMARVILRKSKVVILDEATANVDMSTDSFIQEQINKIFADCVVLTIAHRLSTIAHYDKVLVLEKGMKVEYDHPYRLLVEEVGDKSITKRNGVFAEMVKKNGEKVSQEIFNLAYSAYKKKCT